LIKKLKHSIMNLFDKITRDLKAAMLAKERDKLEALRAIKTALIHARTEKGASRELTPGTELMILQKLIKQRKEAAEIYISQGREDLYNNETTEISVIEKYLPEQLSKDELTQKIQDIIRRINASSSKDMGKVMSIAAKEFAGKAENKLIAEIAKKMLNSMQ
jgi:uncharacterized protein YqeY